jgi:hypothetical protein
MGEKMKHTLYAVGMAVVLLSGNMWGQQWRDWTGASNNYTILYHYRVLNSKLCDLEFKDENQGDGYSTFDAAVDYDTTTTDSNNAPSGSTPPNNKAPNTTRITKTNSVHVVTTRNHNGVAQVPNCLGVSEVRISFVQRQ